MDTYDFRPLNRRTVESVYNRVSLIHLLIVLIVIFTSCDAFAQARRIELSDISNLVRLSDPQISPDKEQIVLVVSRPDFEDNRYENELVLVDITTGAKRLLTYDRPRVRHPRWSPSGDRLAFLAIGKQEMPQIFIMPLNGGDAKRITNAPRGVKSFSWCPNGQELAYVAEDGPEKKEDTEKHNKAFEVGDNVYLAQSASMPSHLWLVSVQADTARRLTSGNESVGTFWGLPIKWSPDGQVIAFNSQPRPHSVEFLNNVVKLFDIKTATLQVLVSKPPVALSGFSADGRYIAYYRPTGPEPFFNPGAVFMKPIAGGEEVNLTSKLDRDVRGLWMPDGEALLVSGPEHTRMFMWLQPLRGTPQKLDIGPIDPVSPISIGSDGALAFVGVEPHHPPELYYMPMVHSRPQRITDFNAQIASLYFGAVKSITWKGPDGFEENGVLVYPPDFDNTKKYPLVLSIHGGPMSTSYEGFSPNRFLRYVMAARDWIVFSPNYRGSNNMGREFQSAVINDAGDGPGRDVMSGIDAVKALGCVDEERIAVSGWSYGGYMTTWLIAHYQGWKAAVAGAAVTDWFDWYNLADLNVWSGYGLGGSPWLNDNAQAYWKQSPITYAPKIRTPTLILSNTGDPRVTVTQSYKLYHALKDNDVPVQFIAYPIPGHFPTDPVHQRDVFKRWIGWIEMHFEATDTKESKD